MQERIIAEFPVRNRRRALVVGSILTILGAVTLWLKGTESIVGRILLIGGVSILILLAVLVCKKVEIVGSCGISKAFLKKRLFYLSEVEGIDFTAGGDRVVAYDAGRTQIFETMRKYGNYTEIISCCHKGNESYVDEPQVEKAGYKNRVEMMLRLAVYLGIVWNVVSPIISESFTKSYLFGLAFIIMVRFCIVDAIFEAEDGALEEHGVCIRDAVLVNYLDCTFGRAYPVFEFRNEGERHQQLKYE